MRLSTVATVLAFLAIPAIPVLVTSARGRLTTIGRAQFSDTTPLKKSAHDERTAQKSAYFSRPRMKRTAERRMSCASSGGSVGRSETRKSR